MYSNCRQCANDMQLFTETLIPAVSTSIHLLYNDLHAITVIAGKKKKIHSWPSLIMPEGGRFTYDVNFLPVHKSGSVSLRRHKQTYQGRLGGAAPEEYNITWCTLNSIIRLTLLLADTDVILHTKAHFVFVCVCILRLHSHHLSLLWQNPTGLYGCCAAARISLTFT